MNKQVGELELLQLLAAAEQAAAKYADGHLTLFRFTTEHWKGFFGTVCAACERERVSAAPKYRTLPDALRGLLATIERSTSQEKSGAPPTRLQKGFNG